MMEKECKYEPTQRFFLYLFVIITMFNSCDILVSQKQIIEMLETKQIESSKIGE